MEALRGRGLVEGLPPEGEALRVAREWIGADWWVGPQRKPLLQEPERFYSGRLRSWAVRVVRDALGHRVVQARRAFWSEVAVAIVKSRAPSGDYRVLLAYAVGFERVRLGRRKRVTPVLSMVLYATMSGRNASPLDRVKPRMRRAFPASGYALAAYKQGIAPGLDEQDDPLAAILEDLKSSGTRESGRAIRAVNRSYSLRDSRGKTLEGARWREYVQCETVEAWIVEEQSKWVLPLLPLILWKWYYHVTIKPVAREPYEPLCDALIG